MLCVIPHIREYSNRKYNIKVNTVIKTLFAGLSEKYLHETLDTFWSENTKFNHNNDPFDSDKFIWSSKDIHDVNIHLWHHKYSLPFT